MKDNAAGIYTSAATRATDPMTASPLLVYASRGNTSDTFSLGVCPIGFVAHTLALTGPPGNLQMTDVMNPASRTFPAGTEVKWGRWRLEGVPAFGADEAEAGGAYRSRVRRTVVEDRQAGTRKGTAAKRQEGPGGPITPKKGKDGPGTKGSTSAQGSAKEGGRVTYSDGSDSRWLAFPAKTKGDWTVKWYDGTLTWPGPAVPFLIRSRIAAVG